VSELSLSDRDLPPIPGYPGFLALLALYIFLSKKVDVMILETGIGGENDSTNIFLRPVATGITAIGLDHVKTLSDTLEKIAWHKSSNVALQHSLYLRKMLF
jgi:folylpolyglutamate synthase